MTNDNNSDSTVNGGVEVSSS